MEMMDAGLLFIHRLLGIHTERTLAHQTDIGEFSRQYLYVPLIEKMDYLSVAIREMKDRDIIHFTDPLGVRVSLVRVGETVCILGPYMTDVPSVGEIKKRLVDTQLRESFLEDFQSYLQKLPLVTIDSLYYATHTLMQSVVGYNSNALVRYINLDKSENLRLQAESAGAPITHMPQQLYAHFISADENVALYCQLETTLANQMTNGETAQALATLARMEKINRHEDRQTDLEGMKLSSAVLCTKMRQSAIQAGVLPTLAEIRARYFLALIRSADSVGGIELLRKQMLSQFCDLIRKEKMGNLSPKIRQVVQFVMADLSGDLSVETLAAQVNLSPNYLSASFKKEMNQSLTAYIRNRRLESAAQFLVYTNMSVHDVAVCVGITDFSYFTKMFREKYGLPPSEYRMRKV